MAGQINRGSLAGEAIYSLSKDKNNMVFLETGTWNGQGSTKCFMDALFERHDQSMLYSIESHKKYYDQARQYWDPITNMYKLQKLNLMLGRIIEPSEVMTLEDIAKSEVQLDHPDWKDWLVGDMEQYNLSGCKNIYDNLPDKIDVLLLDGGEFSSYAEYVRLKDRTKIILLDDSNVLKNYKVKKELLSSDSWLLLLDYSHERNGFIGFQRK
tara:strand:+ start:578 stop:1210 length:633 start_codon:yes stop_codon:yes gene_type:complete